MTSAEALYADMGHFGPRKDEKQAITVAELSPTAHLALQHNQLLS
jgi:K+ transporter